MKIDITVNDPRLTRATAALTAHGTSRTQISQAMGGEVRSLIVRHLQEEAGKRHTTANRLGATPTGFLANLAENFDQSSTTVADEHSVTITMRHPAILRAVRDVTILPKKQFLVIPLNALAYGRRPLEFGKGGAQLVRGRGTEIASDRPAFLLVRSVTQRRDPTLLPTTGEIQAAAITAVENLLQKL